MTIGPKTYPVGEWPETIVSLTHRIVPAILAGNSTALVRLRAQFELGKIEEVHASGCGYFVVFNVPDTLPQSPISNVAGGDALIELSCTSHGAGCVLFVREGKISMFELYTYDADWPDDAEVLSVSHVRGLFDTAPE